MYDHFKDLQEGSCKEPLAVAQDAHQWVLAATALLEDKIERLSCSLNQCCRHSRSHKCLGSHCEMSQAPQAESCQGGSSKGWTQSPSPGWSRRHIIFDHDFKEDTRAREPHPLTWEDIKETRMEGKGLPALNPYLWGFLARAGGDNSQQTLPPKPSHRNSSEWVTWHAKQLNTSTWWQELSEVPGQSAIQEFVRRVWASFQLPR